MKKLVQKIVCYTTRNVIDVTTGRHETATYTKVFGYVVKITYTPVPVQQDELSTYLGII
jgi:hypothetical protein